MCVDEDKCVSGYGYWTVRVGVGPSLSERLPTYLHHRGSGLNVVQNVGCVNSCLEVQNYMVMNLLCGSSKYM